MKLVVGVVLVLALAGGLATLGFKQVAKRDQVLKQLDKLETRSNDLGMQLVKVPNGSFVMGDADHGPTRKVRVPSFYIGTREVTQAQWQAVMGYNPSAYKDPLRPVENVTWLETQSFLERLNRLEGTNKYRLPSEAEWEYAARAGSKGRYFFGDDPGQLRRYAWFGAGERQGTEPVGQRLPNPWGLYDIYGNVWEWVQDCWHPDYTNAPGDSRVWGGRNCTQRVVRGGGWANQADYLGSTIRGAYDPKFEDVSNGFRVVMEP
jgi:formylglycine-generating enzyme required for sulfatase activity